MKSSIERAIAIHKLPLLIIIATPILLLLMCYFLEDITVSLYVLFAVFVSISAMLLIVINPFWGLIIIILYGSFNSYYEIPLITSGARLIGIIITIGWFLKYYLSEKTLFFDLTNFNGIIVLIFILMISSTLLASFPHPSLKYTIQLIILMSIVFFIPDFVRDKKQLNILIFAVAISLCSVSFIGIVQYVNLSSGQEASGQYIISNKGEIERMGGLEGANAYAQALMGGIPLLTFLSFNHRNFFVNLICFCFLIASIVSLGLSISRTHLIGFSVFMITYILLNIKYKTFNKKQILILLIFSVFFTIILSSFLLTHISQRSFEGDDNSSQTRYHVFIKAIKLLMEHPLLGIGFQHMELINHNYQPGITNGRAGHDIISILFVSIGIPGSLIFIFLFYKTLKYLSLAIMKFAKQKENYLMRLAITIEAAFIAQLFVGFGNAVVFNRMLWIYIALAVVFHRWSKSGDGRLNENWINNSTITSYPTA